MNHQQYLQQQQEQHQQYAVLQDAYIRFLTQNLQMPSINTYQHLSSQYIDQLVEIEMKRLKDNCKREEENYVEQMLSENPIIVERRTTTAPAKERPLANVTTATSSYCSSTLTNQYNCNITLNNLKHVSIGEEKLLLQQHQQQQQQQQQQRSESCRRSRINNKIKKAKIKYRHKFMSNKMLESANVLECLQNLIEQTETQLINQGFNTLQLLNLKNIFYNNFIAHQ